MRGCVVPALAVLLLAGVSGTVLCGDRDSALASGKELPLTEEAQASCRIIAEILSVYPTLVVRTSEGPVRDPRSGYERHGCRVRAAGPAWGLVGEVPPDQALRTMLGQLGWKEDLRHAADGPGTTSFALWKDGILCLVAGGAASGIEDGNTFRAGTYELETACAAEPAR